MHIKFFVLGLVTLGSILGTPVVALSAPVDIRLVTGGDDLRGGSYANFYLKLRNQPLLRFNNFTSRHELPNNSLRRYIIEVPQLTDASQVEYCEIEHVSQESFGQTADNWNLNRAFIIMRRGTSAPLLICESRFHRFQGNTRRLTLPPAR